MKNPSIGFLIITLLLSSNARFLWAEEIGTAFGVTIGKPFPEKLSGVSAETNGVIIFHFFKTQNVKYITSVVTASLFNDKTNYVSQITGFGDFDSKVERDEAFDVLKNIISSKYKSPTSKEEESMLKNKFSIDQGSRSVLIESKIDLKKFPRAYLISVIYSDEVLAKKTIEAQKQIKVKETNSESF